jgi:hypothetical protein
LSTCLIEFYCCFLHINTRQFIDHLCVHTLFHFSLFWICLKQYNLEFCSSVGNIAIFQVICIIDLFDQILLLFYEVNYRFLKHGHNLIHGAIYWKLEYLQFWLLWFCWQECRLSNDVTHAHEWMTSLCLALLRKNADLYYTAV